MSYLVLHKDSPMCRLYVCTDEEPVPMDTVCWWVEPQQLNRAVAKIKKFWLSGSMYEKGALLVIDQAEAVEHLRAVLGPSLEEQIEAKEATKTDTVGVGFILLIGLCTFTVSVFWIGLQTLLFIALIPVAVMLIARIIK